MNIAYHCTDNYARITATSIVSVFENNRDASEINVYIIENGFTDETKHKFSKLAERYGRTITTIPLPDLNKEFKLNLVSIKKSWMFDSYSRLFLDRILPKNVERVIYLDGDTLVLNSLKNLWEMNLEGKCCAACMDCISDAYYRLFKVDKCNRYCNSGVILIDLIAWKNKKIDDMVAKCVRKNKGYVFFMEQTVFNVVLQKEIRYLPAEYNVSTLEEILTYNELMKLRKPLHFYTADEVSEAILNPVVVHMTGFFYVVNRAWNKKTNHPEKERFAEYSKKLGWNGNLLEEDNRNFKIKVKDAIIHIVPRTFIIKVVSYIYNDIRVRNINRNIKKHQQL